MPHDPGAALKIFFAIPQAQIDQDVKSADGRYEELHARISEYLRLPMEKQTPQRTAAELHDEMLQAHALSGYKPLNLKVEPERALFLAHLAAGQVAQLGCDDADAKGEMGKLSAAMEQIRQREGLGEDDYWPRGQGPADFEALSAQSDALYDRIYKTMLPHALRRYRFSDFADLYEKDPKTYELMREVGRRLVHTKSTAELNTSFEQTFLQTFGREALIELHERLKSYGLKPALDAGKV